CAMLGELLQARRQVAPLGMGRRHGWSLPQRCDVGGQRLELPLREQYAAPTRLLAGIRERHVPGAQVEVRRLRADALQRRAEPRCPARTLDGREDAPPGGSVAGDAVAAEEVCCPVDQP